MVFKKPSGKCPECKTFVKEGDDGVVCGKCDAFLHFECAGVSQEILDQEWKDIEFVCVKHRHGTVEEGQTDVSDTTPMEEIMTSDSNTEDIVVTMLKVTPYKMNNVANLKKMIKFLNRNLLIESKDMGKQYKVSLGTATYHLLVNNLVSVGESIGLKIVKNDVDESGKKVSSQFNLNLDAVTQMPSGTPSSDGG